MRVQQGWDRSFEVRVVQDTYIFWQLSEFISIQVHLLSASHLSNKVTRVPALGPAEEYQEDIIKVEFEARQDPCSWQREIPLWTVLTGNVFSIRLQRNPICPIFATDHHILPKRTIPRFFSLRERE